MTNTNLVFDLLRVHELVDPLEGDAGLDEGGDDHGEEGEGELEDVEEAEGDEGLLGVQDVRGVDGDVGGEASQGHEEGGAGPHERGAGLQD